MRHLRTKECPCDIEWHNYDCNTFTVLSSHGCNQHIRYGDNHQAVLQLPAHLMVICREHSAPVEAFVCDTTHSRRAPPPEGEYKSSGSCQLSGSCEVVCLNWPSRLPPCHKWRMDTPSVSRQLHHQSSLQCRGQRLGTNATNAVQLASISMPIVGQS